MMFCSEQKHEELTSSRGSIVHIVHQIRAGPPSSARPERCAALGGPSGPGAGGRTETLAGKLGHGSVNARVVLYG